MAQKEIKIQKQSSMESDVIGTYYETNEPNATIKFTFKGTAIRVIGARHADGADEIRIAIDGRIDKFSVREKTYLLRFP